MDVRRIPDPVHFAEAVSPFLLRDEARHNLMFGICTTLTEAPDAFPDFRLWLVEDEGRPVGAAMLTSPYNLVVARPLGDRVLVELARAVGDEGVEVPGVTGAVPEVDAFASAWEQLTGARPRARMAQRIYALSAVRPVASLPGSMRDASDADRGLLIEWLDDFGEEALGDLTSRPTDQVVDQRLRAPSGGFVFWEDGARVSLSGWSASTPHGARIGPVYTPPELRRRGYATALVAAVSSRLLVGGKRFCFLYTDLANPTSNRIYQEIGYEPVCDSTDYAFEPSP